MATFEEKWNEFKNYLKENVPDWNTQFLNWADARGFGFGGGFFNEFPHTHTYETDLSWLISRMKWTLWRMDSVEARMKAVEDLLIEFVETLDIEGLIAQALQDLIHSDEFQHILVSAFNNINEMPTLYGSFNRDSGTYTWSGAGGAIPNTVVPADGVFSIFRIDNMVAFNLLSNQLKVESSYNYTRKTFYFNRSVLRDLLRCDVRADATKYTTAVCSTRNMGDSTTNTREFGEIKFDVANMTDDTVAIELPYIRLSSSETSRTAYIDYKSTLYIPVKDIM